MSTTYPSSLSGATIAPSISSAPTASPSPAPSKYNQSSNNTSTFTFPREHSFPPFYTLQPTLTTRHAQLLKWSSLILSYCRHFRIYKLSLVDAVESDLFYNKRIGKKLGINDLREVLEFMRKDGRIERVGAGKEIGVGRGEEGGLVWVWWRTPEEWAGALYDWVDETAQKNTVLTLYELTESEATLSQEFHGMDAELLQRALNILVKRGKAQVFGQEDQQGVKFF